MEMIHFSAVGDGDLGNTAPISCSHLRKSDSESHRMLIIFSGNSLIFETGRNFPFLPPSADSISLLELDPGLITC
jgi:hypothetical protein